MKILLFFVLNTCKVSKSVGIVVLFRGIMLHLRQLKKQHAMITFTLCLLALIAGYFTYGRLMERVFGPDDRKTPALTKADGVDYIPLPTWKIFMIQFLNIAGLGPIFGAIMGAKFGSSSYLWIVLGSIFAGAVHDYFAGMSWRGESSRNHRSLSGTDYQADHAWIYRPSDDSGRLCFRSRTCRAAGKADSGKSGCYLLDCCCLPLLYSGYTTSG